MRELMTFVYRKMSEAKLLNCYNDRLSIINELDFDKSQLIKEGIIDCNLFLKED